MFTGIIQNQGKVLSVTQIDQSRKFQIQTQFHDLELGESIAVNGVCLTVAEFNSDGDAFFFISPETLNRSNLGWIERGSWVNLERALTLQSRLSGHVVQGHVDGMGTLFGLHPDSESYQLEISIPEFLARYCVEKGSIAINGVSLTINQIQDLSGGQTILKFTIIPHTWTHTNLSLLKQGDSVNLEVDLLAKFVERLCRR